MKKQIFVFTFLIVFLCFLPIKGESELIFNNSFENGTDGYFFSDTDSHEISDKYFVSGGHSIHIFERKNNDDTVKCDIKNALTVQGTYSFSVYLRLDDMIFDYSKMYGVVQITTDAGVFVYKTVAEKIVNERFVLCSGESNITWNGNIISAYFYPQNSSSAEKCDFYADDFSFKSAGQVSRTPETANNKLIVGVIRNDKTITVSGYLSGSKAIALPYYYDFNTSSLDNVSTQIQNDIDYALYAGIDYFAYNVNDDSYSYHNSQKVKMCLYIDSSASERKIIDASQYFNSEMYQKIDGRPLIVFSSEEVLRNKIASVRSLCDDPYIAVLTDEQKYGEYADIAFIGCMEEKNFSSLSQMDSSLWNDKQGIYVNIGSTDNIPERTAVLGHISDGIEAAKSGKKMILIDSWNDVDSFAFIQPNYLHITPNNGKYQIDISVINGMHSLLNGENISVITARTATENTQKSGAEEIEKSNNNDSSSIDSSKNETKNSGSSKNGSKSNSSTTKENTKNSIASTKNKSKNSSKNTWIFGKKSSAYGDEDQYDPEEIQYDESTENGFDTNDKTDSNNSSRNRIYKRSENDTGIFIIGIIIVAGVAEAILIYKFFAVRKKKDDKKSRDNGPGCGEQSTDQNIPRDNGKE